MVNSNLRAKPRAPPYVTKPLAFCPISAVQQVGAKCADTAQFRGRGAPIPPNRMAGRRHMALPPPGAAMI